MKEKKICDCCGAKIVEYKHSFSKALAIGLYKLYAAGKPINIKYLRLTRNQWDNFQKLRYWGLVVKTTDESGNRKGGCWEITSVGVNFVEKNIGVIKSVWTYRGETVRFEGNTCFFSDIHEPEYKQREEYAEEAVAHI